MKALQLSRFHWKLLSVFNPTTTTTTAKKRRAGNETKTTTIGLLALIGSLIATTERRAIGIGVLLDVAHSHVDFTRPSLLTFSVRIELQIELVSLNSIRIRASFKPFEHEFIFLFH